MPVKLTSDGKPLGDSVKQASAPEPAPSAVDALLENAEAVPEAKPMQVTAKAEVGNVSKDGAITVETTEYVKVWLKPPHSNYQGPYGKVTHGMGATINTGNYENFRPFVQIEVPFIPGQQDEAYAYAEDWTNSRITNIVNAAKAAISGA